MYRCVNMKHEAVLSSSNFLKSCSKSTQKTEQISQTKSSLKKLNTLNLSLFGILQQSHLIACAHGNGTMYVDMATSHRQMLTPEPRKRT